MFMSRLIQYWLRKEGLRKSLGEFQLDDILRNNEWRQWKCSLNGAPNSNEDDVQVQGQAQGGGQ